MKLLNEAALLIVQTPTLMTQLEDKNKSLGQELSIRFGYGKKQFHIAALNMNRKKLHNLVLDLQNKQNNVLGNDGNFPSASLPEKTASSDTSAASSFEVEIKNQKKRRKSEIETLSSPTSKFFKQDVSFVTIGERRLRCVSRRSTLHQESFNLSNL